MVPEIDADAPGFHQLHHREPELQHHPTGDGVMPLHRAYGVQRVVVSTYQAVSGTGMKADQQLEDERQGQCRR